MGDRNDVNCDGCSACCVNERVILSPAAGDDPDAYWTNLTEINGSMETVLAHKPNGECVYLTKKGCAIHDRAP